MLERQSLLPDLRVNRVEYSQPYRSSDVSLLVDHLRRLIAVAAADEAAADSGLWSRPDIGLDSRMVVVSIQYVG